MKLCLCKLVNFTVIERTFADGGKAEKLVMQYDTVETNPETMTFCSAFNDKGIAALRTMIGLTLNRYIDNATTRDDIMKLLEECRGVQVLAKVDQVNEYPTIRIQR